MKHQRVIRDPLTTDIFGLKYGLYPLKHPHTHAHVVNTFWYWRREPLPAPISKISNFDPKISNFDPKMTKIDFWPQKYQKNHDVKKGIFESIRGYLAEIWPKSFFHLCQSEFLKKISKSSHTPKKKFLPYFLLRSKQLELVKNIASTPRTRPLKFRHFLL